MAGTRAKLGILCIDSADMCSNFLQKYESCNDFQLVKRQLEFKELINFNPDDTWSGVILFHSAKLGRLSLTDVLDSRYDELLESLENAYGNDAICVIAYNVANIDDERRGTFYESLKMTQPSVFARSSGNVFICSTLDHFGRNESRSLDGFLTNALYAHLKFDTIQTEPVSKETSVILVTGAEEYLGSHIVRLLREYGYTVREEEKSTKDHNHSNLSDEEKLTEAVSGCTHVIHTTGKLTEHLLQTCKSKGVQRVVVTGTCNLIDGDNLTKIHEGEKLEDLRETCIFKDAYLKTQTEENIQRGRPPGLQIITIRSSIAIGSFCIQPKRDYEEVGREIVLKYAGNDPPDSAINVNFPVCDVNDIARAHIVALKKSMPRNMYESVEPQKASYEDIFNYSMEMKTNLSVFSKPKFWKANFFTKRFLENKTSEAILRLYGKNSSWRRQLPISYLVEREYDVKRSVTEATEQLIRQLNEKSPAKDSS